MFCVINFFYRILKHTPTTNQKRYILLFLTRVIICFPAFRRCSIERKEGQRIEISSVDNSLRLLRRSYYLSPYLNNNNNYKKRARALIGYKNEGEAPFFLNHEKKRKRKVSKLRSSVCLSVKKAFGVDSFIIKLYIIKLKAGDSLRVKKHTTHTSSEASENDDDSDDERRFLFPNQTTITSSRPSSWRFSP